MSRAIGVISTSASTDRASDEATIAALARARGMDVQTVVTIHPGTFMPTTLVVSTLHDRGATAVIAPGAAHFAGAENAMVLVADLVTPAGMVHRRQTRR